MTDSNSPISQKINSLIQEIETGFQAIKAAKGSELAPQLNLAKKSTGNLQVKIQGKVDAPELNNAIAKTTAVLVSNKPIVKDEIETLKQENEALASALPGKLQQLNLPEPDLSELTTAIQNWLNEINKILEDLRSISEFNQTTDSILLNIKDKLTQLSQIFESEGTLETLLCEIKAEMKKIIEEPNLTDFSKKIDDLVTEQTPVDQTISELNLRLDKLIQDTRLKINTLLPELDREVQGELGKLIKVAGIAQVELKKAQVELKKAQVEVESKKAQVEVESKKAQVEMTKPQVVILARVKAIVEYLEIAIDSLTGKPNLILAQKLRYASETRLRKIQGGKRNDLANLGDDFFHSIKTPTKVLTGAVSAFPISWLIIYGIHINLQIPIVHWPIKVSFTSPVQDILKSLPLPEVPRANQVYNIANQAYSQEVQVLNFISSSQNTKEKNQDTLNFVIALLMTGTLGGAVSIFLRIKEFDNSATQKYEDDLLPFLIGLLKPILGGSFAFFIFLLLNSGVSPVQIKGQGSNYLYGFLAFAFIAGFSERFVPDLISQTEKNLTQSQGLPIELKIDPQNISLVSEQKQTFKLNQILSADDYSVTLNPPNMGKCEKSQSQFDYSAPKKEGTTPSSVIITVTKNIDPKQTAQTTVILI